MAFKTRVRLLQPPPLSAHQSGRPSSPAVFRMPAAPPCAAAACSMAPAQSLLFQLEIESIEPPQPRTARQVAQRDVHAVIDRLELLTRPESSFEARLARDARYHHAATVEEEGRADVVILASRLASIGLAVTLRTAVGGGSGVSAFKHLSHEFVVVAGPPLDGVAYSPPQEYIIDPRFRDQFDIPQTVPWYSDLLMSVPDTYVGPASRLRAVVRLLGGEMAAAFQAAGAVTPPWRSPSSLLSKWLPQKSRDLVVADPTSPPRGAASYPTVPSLSASFGGVGGTSPFGHATSSSRRRLSATPTQPFASIHEGAPAAVAAAPKSDPPKLRPLPPRPIEGPASQRFGSSRFDASVPRRRPSNPSGSSAVAVGPADDRSVFRTISASAIVNSGTAVQVNNGGSTGDVIPPSGLPGASDSEDDRMSSPDTTLAWTFPHSRGAAVRKSLEIRKTEGAIKADVPISDAPAGDPSVAELAAELEALGDYQQKQLQRHALPRIPSQDQLAAGTGGRSPPSAARLAQLQIRNALPAGAAAPGSSPAPAHPQALPFLRRRTAPVVPIVAASPASAAPSAAPALERETLRAVSTSALSTKLRRQASPRAPAVAQPAAQPAITSPFDVQAAVADTGSVAATRPSSALQQQPRRQPSVPAPFWEQPLIVDYIAAQHPGNSTHGGSSAAAAAADVRPSTGGSRHDSEAAGVKAANGMINGGATAHGSSIVAVRATSSGALTTSSSDGGGVVGGAVGIGGRSEAAVNGPPGQPGEPRIRTVKMRGGNGGGAGGTLHMGPRTQRVW